MLLAPYRFSLAPPPNDQELTPHKYWRLYITEADSANSIGIRQIEFRATPGGPTQSTGGTASASTEYDSYRQAQFAFDDDAGSTIYFWSSTAGLPQWIAYEHAAPVVVREVMIKARNDGDTYGTGPENFIVQSSDNGTVWNDEWTVTGATGWTNGEVRTFERPAVATGLLAGLAHWYELDEASGTRMDSVRGAHLSIAGTVVGAPSPVGTGATIGGGAYMFHTGSIVADLSNTDLTIAGVFNGSSAATGLVAFGNGDINGRQVWVLTENGNFVVTMSTGGNSNTVVLTVPGKGDNGAHRFIMWRDRAADVIGVQIDGEAPVTVPFDGDLTLFAPGTRQLMMGQLGSNIYTGGAQLDGVGVWTRALSADERTQLYNDGAWRTFAQLGEETETEVDPYWTNVAALLHFDGADGSTVFTDATGRRQWSVGAGAQIDTAQSKFGGASGLFGTGGVSTPSVGLDFGTADFNIEMQLRPGAASDGEIASHRFSGFGSTFWILRYYSDGTIRFYNKVADVVHVDMTTNLTVPVGGFKHVAVTRQGTTFRIWVDGQLGASATSSAPMAFPSTTFVVGAGDENFSFPFTGHIDEFRITKGRARYVAPFTPPAAAFPNAAPAGDRYWNYVVSLLHFNGADGSTTITDETGLVWARYGNAQIDTSESVFGGASLELDGASFIQTAVMSDFDLYGNLTVDAKFRHRTNSGNQTLFTVGSDNGTRITVGILNDSFGLYLYTTSNGNSGIRIQSGAGTVAPNTFHSARLVHDAGEWRLLLNDQVVGTSNTAAFPHTGNFLAIGAAGGGDPSFNGHIDEFRYTKGIARTDLSAVAPYPNTQSPVEVFVDSFNVDSAPLYTYSGDSGGGLLSTGGGLAVMSNTQNRQAVWSRNDFIAADCYVEADYLESIDGGIVARFTDNGNYYLLTASDDSGGYPSENVRLYKRVGGNFVPLGSANFTWVRGVSQTLRLECVGTLIRAKRNGVTVIEVTDTSHASGKIGLRSSYDGDKLAELRWAEL